MTAPSDESRAAFEGREADGTGDLTADVVVIGAGWAGLSTAVRLSESGCRVVVVEEAPRLGGRASTFVDRASGEAVDNGQHVLFGCYRDTYAFLSRIGTAGLAPVDRSLVVTMADAEGRSKRLACPSWPSPWHLVAGVLLWGAMPMRDRLTALNLAGPLRRLRRGAGQVERDAQGETVDDWLRAHGQSSELCRWLWHPLAVAALNQAPDLAAAAPFLRVLAELFGPQPDDASIGLPAVPLDALYAVPAARRIEQRGGVVLMGAPATIEMDRSGRPVRVRAGKRVVATRAIVSAVPWYAIARLWAGAPPAPLVSLCAAADRMACSPIVTTNLWFDRPIMRERFIGLVGASMHWAFDKGAILGNGAHHISVVSSGAADLAAMENEAITRIALHDLQRALPEARSARLVRAVAVRERRATFSLAPGQPERPETRTALPGFFLAGDWVQTGLPATIEGAVRSGHAAADAILAR